MNFDVCKGCQREHCCICVDFKDSYIPLLFGHAVGGKELVVTTTKEQPEDNDYLFGFYAQSDFVLEKKDGAVSVIKNITKENKPWDAFRHGDSIESAVAEAVTEAVMDGGDGCPYFVEHMVDRLNMEKK